MRLTILSGMAVLVLSLALIPTLSSCEAVASYLLYQWIQDQLNNENKEAPVITKILADREEVHVGESVVLEVQAKDDKDSQGTLKYQWIATAGVIESPTSRITIWRAPNTAGQVAISVIVKDSDGNQDSQMVLIEVLP